MLVSLQANTPSIANAVALRPHRRRARAAAPPDRRRRRDRRHRLQRARGRGRRRRPSRGAGLQRRPAADHRSRSSPLHDLLLAEPRPDRGAGEPATTRSPASPPATSTSTRSWPGCSPPASRSSGARPADGQDQPRPRHGGPRRHAVVRRPVLLFSLEMGHLELCQRLLASEARVDGQRVRTGRLHEADWRKLGLAVSRLDDAPIFIDDNPNVTVMDIRARARRLQEDRGRPRRRGRRLPPADDRPGDGPRTVRWRWPRSAAA